MRKKTILSLVLATVMLATSACFALIPGFLTGTLPWISAGQTAKAETAVGQTSGELVTISREEYERLKKFSDLQELIDAANLYYYQDVDEQKMLDMAAKGLLSGLGDPYTFYYTAKEFEQMWKDDEGNYTGIGVLINANYKTQICTISRVFNGSPAQDAGVLRGDILYRVGEDLYVTADNLTEAVNIMRGIPGTDVDVTFLRNGEEITFTITRREIQVNQVESTLLEDNIGYIAFYEFAGKSEIEFETALNALIEKGVKGIILDLRDNPGGWVEQARYVADLFMDASEVCYLVYKNGEEVHSEYMTKDGRVDLPLVVLINENSASSSEILTIALKERADATVVGVKSFGKGIIQGVMSVGNAGAGFQMTVAEYFSPDGTKIHQVGITPDVEVPLEEGDNGMYDFADGEKDPQLKKAIEVMQEKLK